jgi:hypothetical protein
VHISSIHSNFAKPTSALLLGAFLFASPGFPPFTAKSSDDFIGAKLQGGKA